MQREEYMEILMDKYCEAVQEIIVNCCSHCRGHIDCGKLNTKLELLPLPEAAEPLSEDEWYEIIYELAPDVYDQIYYGSYAA